MIEGETPGAPAGGSPGAGSPAPGLTGSGSTPQSSWFRVLFRLWCLKSADAPASGNPLAALIVLSVTCLSAWVAIDWWQRRPDPELSMDGIPLLAWYVLAVLALGGLLRWRTRPRPAFGAMLVLVLAVVPVP